MLKIVLFLIADFESEVYEIHGLLKLGVCTFSDPHTQNWDQFCTKTVYYLLM